MEAGNELQVFLVLGALSSSTLKSSCLPYESSNRPLQKVLRYEQYKLPNVNENSSFDDILVAVKQMYQRVLNTQKKGKNKIVTMIDDAVLYVVSNVDVSDESDDEYAVNLDPVGAEPLSATCYHAGQSKE